MQLVKLHVVGILMAVALSVVSAQNRTTPNATETEFPTRPGFEWPTLKLSDVLRAKAMLKWLINNRTENGTKTFNAGFIRLIFHDCVGGCDGCVNLRNPSNSGLGFYKLPLDTMYRDFIFPMMSRADWYALAGITAVEYAAELTPCQGRRCRQILPELNFLYGRKDCVSESNLFRFIPGPNGDPRFTIRNTFRLNFAEITALMGAHCLGKNHQRDTRWVDDGTKFNNQYYKDMLADSRQWKRGNGTQASEWKSQSSGNVMLSSDMFMAFQVSDPEACTEDPMEVCNKTNTFQLVRMFAEDNEFWMREFSVAFNVMLMNGNFGRLKIPKLDTLDKEWTGDLFGERNEETDYVFDREAFGLPPLPAANATNNGTNNATDSAESSGDGAAVTTNLDTTESQNNGGQSGNTNSDESDESETGTSNNEAATASEEKPAKTEEKPTKPNEENEDSTAAASSGKPAVDQGVQVDPSLATNRVNTDLEFRQALFGTMRQRSDSS